MFALIDCNNFYVSCERLFEPGLHNKPVIVLSNNDGCAISRSDEAKALGIKMGAAPHLMQELLKQHNVKVFSSNYELYGDISDRVMKTLATFVPRMEIYSIDEAFLDMSGMNADDLYRLSTEIKKTIAQNLGVPVCIGIAPTKTLAKMANRYAKKMCGKKGIYFAKDETAINRMLTDTKVGDTWGVGRQYAAMLQKNNIHTALDLVKAPEDFIRSSMNVVGLRTQKELKGIPCIEWKTQPAAKKIIAAGLSFGKLVTDIKTISEALANYVARAALKLRRQHSVAGNLMVFVHTNPYRVQDQQYYQSVVVEFEQASSDTAEIIKYAHRGLQLIFRQGFNYLKCGIELGKIVPEEQGQLSLFSTSFNQNNKATKVLDKINSRFGKELVKLAIQQGEANYKPRAAHLSRCYTTRIEDVLKIKI